MVRLQRFIPLAALASLLALPGGVAASTDRYVEDLSVTWDGAGCPAVPEGMTVEFTGTLRGHLHVSEDANGVFHVNFGPDTAVGTAVDSDGGTYRFNYHNMLVVRESSTSSDVMITDHFVLVGRGVLHGLRVTFQIKLEVTQAGEEVHFFRVQGDPLECDPI